MTNLLSLHTHFANKLSQYYYWQVNELEVSQSKDAALNREGMIIKSK
jgi:hypothetical protein